MRIIYCITQLLRVIVWQPLSAITLLQSTTPTTASARLQAMTQTPVVPQTRTTTRQMKMMMNSLTSHQMTGEWEMGKSIIGIAPTVMLPILLVMCFFQNLTTLYVKDTIIKLPSSRESSLIMDRQFHLVHSVRQEMRSAIFGQYHFFNSVKEAVEV